MLNSFLFDDGWDDPKTLWGFHSGFPNGFSPLRDAAARYGTAPGVWMSPWGGYGKPKAGAHRRRSSTRLRDERRRLRALRSRSTTQRFLETCLTMIRRLRRQPIQVRRHRQRVECVSGQRVRQRLRCGDHVDRELRAREAGPLRQFDDGDVSVAVLASLRGFDLARRRGPRFRRRRYQPAAMDHVSRRRHVRARGERGSLFPLNALMLHGMIYAQRATSSTPIRATTSPSEIRSYFGTGTQLQEMYITPSLLSQRNWDTLAEAANWSRRERRHFGRYALDWRRPARARGVWSRGVVATWRDSLVTESGRQAAVDCDRRRARLRAARRGGAVVHSAKSVGRGFCARADVVAGGKGACVRARAVRGAHAGGRAGLIGVRLHFAQMGSDIHSAPAMRQRAGPTAGVPRQPPPESRRRPRPSRHLLLGGWRPASVCRCPCRTARDRLVGGFHRRKRAHDTGHAR